MTLEEEREVMQKLFFKYEINVYQPGRRLKVFSVCYNDFLSIPDMSDDAKDIAKYVVAISEEPNQYRVVFEPDFRVVTHEYFFSSDMRETRYLVDKETLKITNRVFGE